MGCGCNSNFEGNNNPYNVQALEGTFYQRNKDNIRFAGVVLAVVISMYFVIKKNK